MDSFALYGESDRFPDVLHCETIRDRAEENHWVIRPHRHPLLHQFILLERGAYTVHIDGARHESAEPVLLNLPPDIIHGFRFSRGIKGYVLSIPAEELSGALHGDGPALQALAPPLWITPGAELADAFARLHGWYRHPGTPRRPMLRALAAEIACLVAAAAPPPEAVRPHRGSALLTEFERLMRRHLSEKWRVSDYAEALSVTPTHLTRLCRQATGLSAARWIERAVIQEACRELAYTAEPVAQVAYGLGYEDPSHFSRVFRRVTGRSPRDYRQAVSGTT